LIESDQTRRVLEDIKRGVREIIAEITLSEPRVPGMDNIPLEALGVDSIGMIELVYELEERFSIEIDDEDVVPESFHSVDSLIALVIRKCS
jgi:acyl carrier protein